LPGLRLGYPLHLVEDAARLHHHDPGLGRALALAHAGLLGLLGDRLVGENPDPDPAIPLDEARDGDAAGLDLALAHPAAFHGLEAVVAEVDGASRPGLARHAAPLLLSELDLLGHQHDESSLQRPAGLERVQLALVDPGLHPDLAE